MTFSMYSSVGSWLSGSIAVPEFLPMASQEYRMSGSPVDVFHFQEYSNGEPSYATRDLKLGVPSGLGAGPSRGTYLFLC